MSGAWGCAGDRVRRTAAAIRACAGAKTGDPPAGKLEFEIL